MATGVTSRVSGAITENTTARVSGAISGLPTARISGSPLQDITTRVVPSGVLIVSGFSIDTWGGTWGNAWGNAWYGITSSFDSSAIGGSSQARVTGVITENITKRI